MAICGGDIGDDVIKASRSKWSVDFDTSSGDSCWVRQYLEWNLPVDADLITEAIGSKRINVRQVHAI